MCVVLYHKICKQCSRNRSTYRWGESLHETTHCLGRGCGCQVKGECVSTAEVEQKLGWGHAVGHGALVANDADLVPVALCLLAKVGGDHNGAPGFVALHAWGGVVGRSGGEGSWGGVVGLQK